MKRRLALGLLLALWACQPKDPLAEDRNLCGDGAAAAEARIEACTHLIDSGNLDAVGRAEALANRAESNLAKQAVTAALRDYEAALRLNDNNSRALEGRARILLASGQLDAAEPLLDRLVSGGRASADVWRMKGDIALQRSEYSAAIGFFDDAISADGQSALAYAHRARAKEQLRDTTGAGADFDSAIRLDGALAEARAGRCWLNLRAQQDLEQARSDAEAAVLADPRSIDAQLCRGVLALRAGEWENARHAFDAALDVAPGNPTALFGRGVARRRSGDNAGRSDMNQARDFDRHIGETFDAWGVETY